MHNRSICPLANCLDLTGDKWTLVLLRDMYLGKERYGDFLISDECITTNILSSRLKNMIANGLIEKKPYQEKPMRYKYSLKQSGKDLLPVVQAMSKWADKYISGCRRLPDSFYKLTPEDIA